jgi:hypothetical protein
MPNSQARAEADRLTLANNCTVLRFNSGVNCLHVPVGHLQGNPAPFQCVCQIQADSLSNITFVTRRQR